MQLQVGWQEVQQQTRGEGMQMKEGPRAAHRRAERGACGRLAHGASDARRRIFAPQRREEANLELERVERESRLDEQAFPTRGGSRHTAGSNAKSGRASARLHADDIGLNAPVLGEPVGHGSGQPGPRSLRLRPAIMRAGARISSSLGDRFGLQAAGTVSDPGGEFEGRRGDQA